MADDLEAQLSAMEDAAPLTEEIGEDTGADEHFDSGSRYNDEPKNDPNHFSSTQKKTGQEETAETADAKTGDEAQKLPPLTPEELQKRFEDGKGALAKERGLRREAQAQMNALQDQIAALQAQMNSPVQAAQQVKPTGFELPSGYDPSNDVEPDPGTQEHYQWLYRRNKFFYDQQQNQIRAQERQKAIQQQQTIVIQRMQNAVADYEGEFRETTPDYSDAVDFAANKMARRYELQGLSSEQAKIAVTQEFMRSAAQMLDSGINPAEAVYNFAKELGYQGPQVAEPASNQGADKIAQINAGQKSAKTLSAGGSAPSGNMSLRAIANMSGDEFDAAFDKFMR